MGQKKFNQKIENSNRRMANLTMMIHARSLGLYVIENEISASAPGLIVGRSDRDDSSKYFADALIDPSWPDSNLPYPKTVSIPVDKFKFSKLKYPLFLYVVSVDLKKAIRISSSMLEEKYLEVGERGSFFKVPTDECKIISLRG